MSSSSDPAAAAMPLHDSNYEMHEPVDPTIEGENPLDSETYNQYRNLAAEYAVSPAAVAVAPIPPHNNTTILAQQQQQHPRYMEPEIDYGGLALVFLAPALGGFLYGYDIGATSFVLSMMRADRDHDNWWHKNFSKLQQGLFMSCLALGALIGSHIVLTCLANSIGRRKEIRIAATLYIVGAMLNVMSGTVLATSNCFQWPPRWYTHNGDGQDPYYSYEYTSIGFGWGLVSLIAGRLFYGAGVGFIMHGAPTYMAEMSPSNVRGALVSAKETVIVFGIVVGMLMGDLQSDYPSNWTDLYGYSILFAVPMLILTFKIPRSKRWLLMKGYHEEARASMQFVYKGNVEDEFDKMAETINNLCCNHGRNAKTTTVDDCDDSVMGTDSIKQTSGTSVVKAGDGEDNNEEMNKTDNGDDEEESVNDPHSMWSSKYRKIMMIGMGLLLAQQFSGQPCVLAYSRVLFEAAGWGGNTSVVTVTIMGIVSSFTVSQVDRLGRKTLLAAGSTMMLVGVLCLAYGFWGWDEDAYGKLSAFRKGVVLWSMFIFISGYQIGFGPISWTVLSEIYPTEIRGSAMALSVEVNFFAKFLTQFFFPVIQDKLGWGTTFLVFACTITMGLIFICFKVPETKGMTLEEIQLKLKQDENSWSDDDSPFSSILTALGMKRASGDTTPTGIIVAPTEGFQYASMDTIDDDDKSDSGSSIPIETTEDTTTHKLAPIV